jgi:hypothetical protein
MLVQLVNLESIRRLVWAVEGNSYKEIILERAWQKNI